MSAEHLLSIVTPYHGRHDLLSEFLASIPDLAEIEIVLVDDHSPEGPFQPPTPSRATLRHLSLPEGVRYAGEARNLGLAHASGTFVHFCDSDDLLIDENVRPILDRLSPDVDIHYLPTRSFRHPDPDVPGTRHLHVNWLLDRYLRTGSRTWLFDLHQPHAKIYKRDFLFGTGVRFEATRHANDVMFSIRALFAARTISVLDLPLATIRQGNASLTGVHDVGAIAVRAAVLDAFNRFLVEQGYPGCRTPVATVLRTIARHHPLAALEIAFRSHLAGSPVFVSRKSLHQKLLKTLPGRTMP